MFRAEFLSSLDLKIAQPFSYLWKFVLYINDTYMALLCKNMCGFDKYSKLERVVVSLSLLEYHIVVPNS